MSQPLPPRSRVQHLRDWLDPRIKSEGAQYIHFVATSSLGLVSGLIVAFLFAFGVFTAGHAAINWAQRIHAARAAFHPASGVVVPAAPPVKIIVASGGALPASAGINFNFFTGTDTQGDRSTTTCEAHVVSKAESYDLNRRNHTHITVSARLNFDDASGGKMIPTAPQWYIPVARDHGLVRNKHFSYGPHQIPSNFPPYSAEGSPLFVNRYRKKVPINETFLWGNPSPGAGAITKIRQQIGLHQQPVLITMPMYTNAEAAAWYTGHITTHAAGDTLDFYHGVICTRYQDNRLYQGVRGWVLCNNSWGPLFGVDQYGNLNYGHGGYFWYSYTAIEHESLQGLILTLVQSGKVVTPGGGSSVPPRFVPSHAPTFKAPYNPGVTAGGGGTWVRNVHLYNDTRYADVSGIINDSAGKAGISAVGLAATLETESNMNPAPTHHYPIAGAGGCDYSAGISQFTVCTIAGAPFYIGNGSLSASNIGYVFNWEDTHPTTMIQYAAILLGEYKAIACVDFNPLYVAWNSGPYAAPCGSSYWWNPGGNAYGNYQNFLGWANYSALNFSTSVRSGAPAPRPPAPRIFPRVRWNRYVTRWNTQRPHHKLVYVPYLYRGKVSRVASFWAWTPGIINRCGSPTQHEVWHARPRFEHQQFSACVIYSWPTKRGDPVKVARR